MSETYEYKGYEIEIMPDDSPENPRDWDNLGTMVCFHGRYNLGDTKHGFTSPDDLREYLATTPHLKLPIYGYEHGGFTISTTPFSCPWDSGQLGYIFVTLAAVREEYGVKRVSADLKKHILTYLEGEVETYDQYLTGDVWGYTIPDLDDSCWGFYGQDEARDEAEHMIDRYTAQAEGKAWEQAMSNQAEPAICC